MSAGDPSEPRSARWGQLVELLADMPDVVQRLIVEHVADMPDVVQRLIVEHVPDENNRCRGCTLPGTGRPNEPWPCSLRKLAEQARRLQPDAVPHDPDETGP